MSVDSVLPFLDKTATGTVTTLPPELRFLSAVTNEIEKLLPVSISFSTSGKGIRSITRNTGYGVISERTRPHPGPLLKREGEIGIVLSFGWWMIKGKFGGKDA